jgi:hypothetical protein
MPVARFGMKAVRRRSEQTRRRAANFFRYAAAYSAAMRDSEGPFAMIAFARSSELSKAITIPLPVKGSMKAAESPTVNKLDFGTGAFVPKLSTATASQSPAGDASRRVADARLFFLTTLRTMSSTSLPMAFTVAAFSRNHTLNKPPSTSERPPKTPRNE